ncbi:MAG TPA: site-specific integrase [Rhodanobacteraceae bacterium]|nr:site-specific integrase [Rhodanobacteraceae bacterium]
MKVPNYLYLAPSGVWHFRARVGGRTVKRSLHTRDRLAAQRAALTLAWHTRNMPRGLVPDGEEAPDGAADPWPGIRRFEIQTNPTGGLLNFKTNGTQEDNAAGLEALRAMLEARATVAPTASSGADTRKFEPLKAGEVKRLWERTLSGELSKTRSIKRTAITSFVAHYGADRVLGHVQRVDVAKWFDALRVELAPPTLRNKESYLAGFFDYARAAGYMDFPKDDHPARGHNPYGPRAKRRRRGLGFRPFTPEHIAALYAPKAVAKLSEAARWGALLGLYTGARVSEVGQLRLVDFVESHGVPCIRITDAANGQSVKTDKSERTVPLHPDLIALGLLGRVAELREAGETRLFPRAKVGGVNGMGNWLSKAFSYHLRREKVTIEKGRLGFHSLRSTLTQRLQDGGIHPEVRAAIEGHELDDEHHASYSRDITPAEMLAALNKVNFGLDLGGLRTVLNDTTATE